ncbi:universal stress protein [Nitrososphaera sp. AFS]|nr:universal stress protein [Nitrososphaera sp. AFS]
MLNYTASENIDLIVIGARSRTGLKRFLIGSTANVVVLHVYCYVLLAR